jgi:hypothetical protein
MHSYRLGLILTAISVSFVANGQNHATQRVCFIGASNLRDRKAPTFAKYPAAPPAPFSNAKLDTRSNPIAKLYRTVLRQEMSKGPNFATYYRVAVWGCGSSCAEFAVVNLKTGRVITTSGINSVSNVHFAADGFMRGTDSADYAFRFRKNSRLLVVVGTLDEDESREGAFYFALKNETLSLAHKTIPTSKTCQDN